MNSDEIASFACSYLQQKDASGLRKLVGEAMLVLALGEYLACRKWDVSVERSLKDIGASSKPEDVGYLSYDLDAARDGGKIVIEAKFLKGTAKPPGPCGSRTPYQRIADDLVKLAYIDASKFQRYLVVGQEKHVVPYAKLPSLHEQCHLKFSSETRSEALLVEASANLSGRIAKEFKGVFPLPLILTHSSRVETKDFIVSVFQL